MVTQLFTLGGVEVTVSRRTNLIRARYKLIISLVSRVYGELASVSGLPESELNVALTTFARLSSHVLDANGALVLQPGDATESISAKCLAYLVDADPAEYDALDDLIAALNKTWLTQDDPATQPKTKGETDSPNA